MWLSNNAIIMMMLAITLIVGIMHPNFFSGTNMINLFKNVSIRYIIALGISGCLITTGNDLSAGRLAGFAACLACIFAQTEGASGKFYPNMPTLSTPVVFILVIAICAIVGLCNGLVVSYLKVQPFIATLGMQQVVYGICLVYTGGTPIGSLNKNLHLSGLQHHHRCACADLDRSDRGRVLLVPVQQDPSRQVHVRHRRQRSCC